jgi:hypothetical protein
MASNNNDVDALGINGSSKERRDSIAALSNTRGTNPDSDFRPKGPIRRRTFTELFKYGSKMTIYLKIDDRTTVEARMRIEKKRTEKAPVSTCQISQTYLLHQRIEHSQQQPHIELRWSPKRDYFVLAPTTLFSVCNDLDHSDCILTREEFERQCSKRTKSFGTFRKSLV